MREKIEHIKQKICLFAAINRYGLNY